MHDREQVACRLLPLVDQPLLPLISPSISVLGKATCPSRNCRIMDGLLAKRQVQKGSEGSSVGELQMAFSFLSHVMKEQAEAAGRALASF